MEKNFGDKNLNFYPPTFYPFTVYFLKSRIKGNDKNF